MKTGEIRGGVYSEYYTGLLHQSYVPLTTQICLFDEAHRLNDNILEIYP